MANWKALGLTITLLTAGLAQAAEFAIPVSAPPPPLFKDPTTGMEFVFVKGGCFQMGDLYNDGSHDGEEGDGRERPVHEVCIGDFYIAKYEVTRGQWRSVVGTDPSSAASCAADDCPVDNVAWSDVQGFISKLNSKDGGRKYRLPTEAEWEYAARSGGKSERYAGGNDVESVAWYEGTTRNRVNPSPEIRPIGTKAPNGLGLYDMSGNVYEFTSDWYDATYYARSPRINPTGPASGSDHVKRGGCANGNSGNLRTSLRKASNGPNPLTGFRLLRIP